VVSELVFAVDTALSAVFLLLLGYAAYRALQIRGALAIGLYRRQALWTSAVAIFLEFILFLDYLYFFFIPYNTVADFVVSFLQGMSILAIFAWIDTSTLIARRSDPLLRDSIHWSRLRKPFWVLLPVDYAIALLISISFVLSGGSLAAPSPPAELLLLTVFLIIPFVLGAILLPLSSMRSGDFVLKRHLRWFGLLVVLVLMFGLLYGSVLASGGGIGFLDLSKVLLGQAYLNFTQYGILVIAGIVLVKTAGSLAPVNRRTAGS
jgi:hypothetical protein